jgi:D-xylose transport system substrate-binding protein
VQIDAVLAENDSTALGVVAALQAKNYDIVPVSGQDGDPANLKNVAQGLQYVDVWKNSNELGKAAGQAALDLCAGTAMADLALPDGLIDPSVAPEAGLEVQEFETPNGTTVNAFILQPTPITAENLELVIEGGWITQEELCEGVDPASAPAACQ